MYMALPLRTRRNPIDPSAAEQTSSSCYELRFAGLFHPGRGYAFPCDADGNVDIDGLGELERVNYFYARTVIGREFLSPVTRLVAASARE